MNTWTLLLKQPSSGTEMTAEWVGGTPNGSTPASVRDVLNIQFQPLSPSSWTTVVLNLSWVPGQGVTRPPIVGFNGTPSSSSLITWNTYLINPTPTNRAYKFRAIVGWQPLNETKWTNYHVDPEMVVKSG